MPKSMHSQFHGDKIVVKAAKPKKMSPASPRTLDETDRRIISELVANGRLTNAALASRTGIAESTCIHRVRALRESGVIRGFHADIDLGALGLPMQAVVKVRLGTHNRDEVNRFHATLSAIPGVLTIFHVAGEDDYLLHVAVESSQALRDLILEHVTVHPVVRHTETQLVFGMIPAAGVST